eukprot:119689_1
METEYYQLFSTVLRKKRSQTLHHTLPTFSHAVKYLVDMFESTPKACLPPIKVGRLHFDHTYFFNDYEEIYKLLGSKMFGIRKDYALILVQLAKKPYITNLQQLIAEFIGKLYIENEQKNNDKILEKIAKIKRTLKSAKIHAIKKELNRPLVVNDPPTIPRRINIISQLILGFDTTRSHLLLTSSMDSVAIDIRNNLFKVTKGKCLLDINFAQDDTFDEDDKKLHLDWMFGSIEAESNIFSIPYKHANDSLKSVRRWNKYGVREYKQLRAELKEEKDLYDQKKRLQEEKELLKKKKSNILCMA